MNDEIINKVAEAIEQKFQEYGAERVFDKMDIDTFDLARIALEALKNARLEGDDVDD